MCYGCYEENGFPKIITDTTIRLGTQARDMNHYGALHIVIDDWNLDDGSIDFCIQQPQMTKDELNWALQFKNLSVDERASVLAIADKYLEIPQQNRNPRDE